MDAARRLMYLERLGLQPLRPYSVAERRPDVAVERVAVSEPEVELAPTPAPPPRAESVSASARAALRARAAPEREPEAAPRPSKPSQAPGVTEADLSNWAGLQTAVSGCTACRLCEHRTQTVFGTGAQSAPVLFVGEGPGADEDRLGEPFVGAAGQLLDRMLAAIGRSRAENVYIANVVKCRPPGNRKPADDEAAACGKYLDAQIDLVQPKLIVALGAVAAKRLLDDDAPVGKQRGRTGDYRGTPVVVTYHPAYYLRSPAQKGKGWTDLKRIRALLDGDSA